MHGTQCLAGAGLLAVGALVGALAPGISGVWERHRDGLLTLSAGLLIGTAALHMLPGAAPLGSHLGYGVLAGFLGVLLLEALIQRITPEDGAPEPPHDHTHGHEHDDQPHMHHVGVDAHERHLAVSAVLGFSLHGVIDGVAVHASSASGGLWTTTAALLVHHLPLAVSCAALLKLGGGVRSFWPIMIGASLTPVLGVVVAERAHVPTQALAAVAAGVFLYVASHNLLPLMDRRRGAGRRLVVLLVGVAFAAGTEIIGG
ncbi:MAG: ZIP family metal transporter [Deltaproteobacteria bacterium]|nr:ZIP family metal transporter [Deltaproteobacteria bacterium]